MQRPGGEAPCSQLRGWSNGLCAASFRAPPRSSTPEVRVQMSPDAPALVREMAEVLEHQPHLSGPDLAATLEPRLEQLVAGLAPSLAPIRRKLFAMRGWLHILRRP